MAGILLGETLFRHRIEADIRPFRDLMLVGVGDFLVAGLASETVFRSTSILLASYPDAIKAIRFSELVRSLDWKTFWSLCLERMGLNDLFSVFA